VAINSRKASIGFSPMIPSGTDSTTHGSCCRDLTKELLSSSVSIGSHMDRIFKASLAIGILLVGMSLSYYFIFFLPAIQKQRLDAQVTATKWEQEQQCAKSAADFFNGSSWTQSNVSAGYDNHFNHKLNKCFILVNATSSQGSSLLFYRVLMDVNGGTQSALATYDKQVPVGVADYMVKPFVCDMLDKYCNSEEEFNAFVKPYMEQ